MRTRQTALAVFGLYLLAGSTMADGQVARVDQSCLVGGQRGEGVVQIATGCPIGRAPALSAFRFGFFNGDHRLRQATLMPNGESFEAAWGDSGGEDPFFVEARWLRIPEAPGGVVTAVVRGVADIPIPAGPPNSTLVLSGFEFMRADGTDANIRTVAIALDGSRHPTIRTVLLDDQGMDFTNLATAIAVGFAFGAAGAPDPSLPVAATGISTSLLRNGAQQLTPGRPIYEVIPAETPPALLVSPAQIARAGVLAPRAGLRAPAPAPAPAAPPATTDAERHMREAQVVTPAQVYNNSARPYRVRVAYLWVPNARLANTRMVSGGGRARSDTSGRLPTGPHVLQGFSFHFGNSDHFIADFGVHLAGGAPVQTTISHDEVVSWEDANRDDPMHWTVRFSDLVDPPSH